MLSVGLDTLPRRMSRRPATRLSLGFVVSFSSPISPFSPGAPLGQSSTTFDGSAARLLPRPQARRTTRVTMGKKNIFIRARGPVWFVRAERLLLWCRDTLVSDHGGKTVLDGLRPNLVAFLREMQIVRHEIARQRAVGVEELVAEVA